MCDSSLDFGKIVRLDQMGGLVDVYGLAGQAKFDLIKRYQALNKVIQSIFRHIPTGHRPSGQLDFVAI